MNAIERLKRDHAILRAKLNVLEAALSMGPQTWFVLREISHTLARQLRDHVKREEALIAECRDTLGASLVSCMQQEHRDESEHLRTINRLFLQTTGNRVEEVRPVLTTLIAGLRHHMEEEEQELFPMLERVGEAHAPVEIAVRGGPERGLEEIMPVTRVLQQYPATRSIFAQLFINIPFEGSDCLDEVAWRHGMEARELLVQLERAIAERPSACECAAI